MAPSCTLTSEAGVPAGEIDGCHAIISFFADEDPSVKSTRIATKRTELTEGLVQWCNQRGERGENRIKDLKIGIVIGMFVGIYARIDYRGRISRVQRENKEFKEKVVEEEKEEEAPVPFTAVEKEEIDQSHTD